MNDEDRPKDEILDELSELRRLSAELEKLDASRQLIEENLRKSDERFRAFADFTYDWETWRGPGGKYIYVSPSCERITGYRKDEFINDPSLIEKIAHPDDREIISEHFHECSSLNDLFHVDFRILSRNGEEKWISHYCQNVYGADGSWLGRRGSNRDISKRKEAERNLHRVNRALTVIVKCNQTMVRATAEGEFLNEVCQLIVDSGGYRLAWVGFSEQDETKSVYPVAQAGFEDGYLETLDITWSDTERGRGPTGTAIRTGKPTICRNILTDPKFIPWRDEASKRGYSSSIALPLLHRGRTFGALNIYADEPDAFDPDEIKLLLDLAEDLAYGIAALRTNADHKRAEEALRKAHQELRDFSQQLEKKVEQRTEELQRKSEQLIEAERAAARGKLANRVAHELRNPITVIGGFSRRMNERMPEHDPNRNYLKVILSEVEVLENKISKIIRLDDEE